MRKLNHEKKLNLLREFFKKKNGLARVRFQKAKIERTEPNQTGSSKLNQVKKDRGINIKLSFLPILESV
jgi:hypothetical protein